MRKIHLIVIHYSAARADKELTAFGLDTMHRRRESGGTGYHYYIRKDGTTYPTRPVERIRAHAKGFNTGSIGICYKDGLDCRERPAGIRTPEQRTTLRLLVHQLQEKFPGCRVCGHHDLSPDRSGDGETEPEEWVKACPRFEVEEKSYRR